MLALFFFGCKEKQIQGGFKIVGSFSVRTLEICFQNDMVDIQGMVTCLMCMFDSLELTVKGPNWGGTLSGIVQDPAVGVQRGQCRPLP